MQSQVFYELLTFINYNQPQIIFWVSTYLIWRQAKMIAT